jgi:cobalt-zinc-cadmium efflux system outer membrane protein
MTDIMQGAVRATGDRSPFRSNRGLITRLPTAARLAVPLLLLLPTLESAAAQHIKTFPDPALTRPTAAGMVLSLEDAVRISRGEQPSILAFEREAEASEHAAITARTLPDPQITAGVTDLPVTGRDAFSPTADNFTMYSIGIMREQVRLAKREAEAARLRAVAIASRAEASAQERRIQRDVMVAWLTAVEASSKQRLLDRIIGDLTVGHQVMEAGIPTGASSPALALQMQGEIALAQAQKVRAVGEELRARAELGRWIGAAAQRPLPVDIPVLRLPAGAQERVDADRHPTVLVAQAQEQSARLRIDVARADRKSNVTWSVNYGYRPRFGDLVTAQITIPLQNNRAGRQDRQVAEALAQADAARLRAEDARREITGAYGVALADYQSADAQLAILNSKALPALEASFEAAEARYGGGQGELELPLTIVRRYVEVSIESIEERAKRARAAAELTYLTEDFSK